MPSKPKTVRSEHSTETVAVTVALHNLGKSLGQISDHVNVPKPTVAHVALIRHVESLLEPPLNRGLGSVEPRIIFKGQWLSTV